MSGAGSNTRLGFIAAAVACAIDQATKLYLLFVFDIAANGPVRLGPFIDIVLTRNRGISYGLLQMQGPVGRWALLGFKAAAILLLCLWLARAKDRLSALALGLIIGGAVGNSVDGVAYGWVTDFVFFHVSGTNWQFNWYVFNLADVAIVAGVIGLLYDSLLMDRAAKAP